MHREAIPEPVWRLLLGLSGLEVMQSVYLAGGTALAIQLGRGEADRKEMELKVFEKIS